MATTTIGSVLCLGVLLAFVGHASAQAEALASPGEPAGQANSADPGTSPAASSGVRVRVQLEASDAVLRGPTGPVCRRTCDLTLAPGVYQFGVSLGDGDVMSDEPVVIDRPGLLRARYVQRSGTRTSGWVLFGISGSLALIGGIGGVAGILISDLAGFTFGTIGFMAGAVNLLIAIAVGLPLVAVGDSAQIRFD